MTSETENAPTNSRSLLADPRSMLWISSSSILAVGLIAGGYLLGDGLQRARAADRSVTVRGLAEKDVMADLATWTLSYSSTADNLAAAQSSVERDTKSIRHFFDELGFPASAIQPSAVNVRQYTGNGRPKFTVRQRMTLRSNDITRAQDAVKRQFELVRSGVVLEEGSGMSYKFTKLNSVKPEMVADATKNARASAEQFAKDSGTSVGTIKRATQGYFSIRSRDGDTGGWGGSSDTPFKKVRVVTTIDFYLR